MIRYDLPTWDNPPTVERAVEWLTSSMDEMDAHNGASLRVVLDCLAELSAAEVERPREMFANELRGAIETVRGLQEENEALRDLLAEFERTQATGGPPPPETRGWANEAVVPAPETAHDQSMAVPDRYQASNQKRSKP